MKLNEAFDAIKAELVQPLIDAITANTATILGKTGTCCGQTAAPAEEAAVPATTGKGRGRKPAAEPTPEPAAEEKAAPAAPAAAAEDKPEVTEADLLAHVKSLPEKGKEGLRNWMSKTFSAGSFGELKANSDRWMVLQKMKANGATDTRTAKKEEAAEEW